MNSEPWYANDLIWLSLRWVVFRDGLLSKVAIYWLLSLLIVQLVTLLRAYVAYFNRSRPYQGIGQQVPYGPPADVTELSLRKIIRIPVLNGLHHAYRRAA